MHNLEPQRNDNRWQDEGLNLYEDIMENFEPLDEYEDVWPEEENNDDDDMVFEDLDLWEDEEDEDCAYILEEYDHNEDEVEWDDGGES